MVQTNQKFVLSPLAVVGFVGVLMAGELASGTDLYFVTMMAVAVLSACLTFNMLGGLGRMAGIGFIGFALGTLVISQVGKVVLFERADKNLDVPQLTITVYAVYYFSLMLGTFTFSRLRLPLPKPIEPETVAQSKYLYAISLAGGVVGALGVVSLDLAGPEGATSLGHGFARALAYLLPFSLVVAVDSRIRATNGRHSLGWAALWPTLALMFIGFVEAGRIYFLEPFGIVLVTCYVRRYRFRRKHFAAAAGFVAAFFFIVSPFYLYARAWRGDATIRMQAATMLRVLEGAPSQWGTIVSTVGEQALAGHGTVNYFDSPGAVTVNRFALIGPDSTLINACSTGFHYGFTALRMDVLSQIPRFIYPNKPAMGSNEYLGHLDGQESDVFETTNSTITTVSDSYGAFGWVGVVVFPFLVVPAIFVVYESMFDFRRPWGTVAMATLLGGLSGGGMGLKLVDLMIKEPIYLLVISWCTAWCVRMIPATGDRATGLRQYDGSWVDTGEVEGHPSGAAL
ncbi:MAG: hypothetical protein WA476_22040 [Acidobacteriaceae bacterium]